MRPRAWMPSILTTSRRESTFWTVRVRGASCGGQLRWPAAGPKVVANMIDCPEEQLRVGMPLEVVFREVTPGVTLPQCRPVD